MMTQLSYDVLQALAGKTLATAESCTGGGIGAELTAVPGSSAVYKGGIIAYTNRVKACILGVDGWLLEAHGAVSAPVAEAMAAGVRGMLEADVAVSVTGLAGPAGDEYGNSVGTVFIGYADSLKSYAVEHHFSGSREAVCRQAVSAALELILQENQ